MEAARGIRSWTQFFFFLLASFLLSLPLVSKAEDSHETGSASTAPRSFTDSKLSDEMIAFLASHFSLPADYIIKKFEPKLPNAIEAVLKSKDESTVSELVAFLMGRINTSQRAAVTKDAKAAIEEELKKDPEKRDPRKLALLKRLLWASMVLAKSPSDKPEAQDFNKKFDPEFKKVLEKNEEVLEKIRQASDGNDKAKDWLRENLSQEAIASFIEGQRATGNQSLADELTFGLAHQTDGGEKFVDFHGPDGDGQRLYLGKTKESTSKAIDGLFAKNTKDGKPGFGGARFTALEHKYEPEKRWFVNEKGEFVKGTPEGLKPNLPIATGEKGADPTADASKTLTDADANAFESLKTFVAQNCQKCHTSSVTGTSLKDAGVLGRSNQPENLSSLISTLSDGSGGMKTAAQRTLPNGKVFLDALGNWAKRQEALSQP